MKYPGGSPFCISMSAFLRSQGQYFTYSKIRLLLFGKWDDLLNPSSTSRKTGIHAIYMSNAASQAPFHSILFSTYGDRSISSTNHCLGDLYRATPYSFCRSLMHGPPVLKLGLQWIHFFSFWVTSSPLKVRKPIWTVWQTVSSRPSLEHLKWIWVLSSQD